MLVTKHAYNAQKQARHALNAVWKTICTLIQQLPAASKNALRAYWKTQAEIFAYRAMIGAILVSAYLGAAATGIANHHGVDARHRAVCIRIRILS